MTLNTMSLATASDKPVRVAVRADTDDLFNTLTRAFADDPVVRWVFPDDQQYSRYFPKFARAFGGDAITHGTALVSGQTAGVALWLPPGQAPDEEAVMAVMAETIPKEREVEVNSLFGALDEHHPHVPHWYLPLIGVKPQRQGEGHGSALLTHALRLCDEAALPAYLEATNERNVALYMRRDFEPVGEIRVAGCPTVTPMLRPAR